MGAAHVRGDAERSGRSGSESVSEGRGPQRPGHRTESDQRPQRAQETSGLRAWLRRSILNRWRDGYAAGTAGGASHQHQRGSQRASRASFGPWRARGAQPEPPAESTSRWLRRFGPAGPSRCAALLRCSGRRVTAYVAARDRMDRQAVATRDGRARRSLQPTGPLSADLGPLRSAVLAPPRLWFVVHARCVRRLLRLRRRHPARCRRIWRARLAPGWRRRAGAL